VIVVIKVFELFLVGVLLLVADVVVVVVGVIVVVFGVVSVVRVERVFLGVVTGELSDRSSIL